MANVISNSISRISNESLECLQRLVHYIDNHKDSEDYDLRTVRDIIEDIIAEINLLKFSIGYKVDDWYMEYLLK